MRFSAACYNSPTIPPSSTTHYRTIPPAPSNSYKMLTLPIRYHKRIHIVLQTLSTIQSSVIFIWIPSHAGQPRQDKVDKVDQAAKEVIGFPKISDHNTHPVTLGSPTPISEISPPSWCHYCNEDNLSVDHGFSCPVFAFQTYIPSTASPILHHPPFATTREWSPTLWITSVLHTSFPPSTSYSILSIHELMTLGAVE